MSSGDLEKSIGFFREGLNLQLAAPPAPLTASQSTLVHRAVAAKPSATARSATLAILGRMKAAGVTVETPGGMLAPLEGTHRAALVRSPDGLLIELRE